MFTPLLPIWPPPLTDSLRLSVALLAAGLAGEGLARVFRLPRITGYSLIGLLLGPSAVKWFGAADLGTFRIFIEWALAMLLFELGIRTDLRWLRANPWILATSLAEAVITFAGTLLLLNATGASLGFSAVVAAIAMGTSPAVVMRVAAETRAEGQVTQRLLLLTALNVIYSVVASKLIVGGMHGLFRQDWIAAVLHPLYLLIGSLIAAFLLATAFRVLRRFLDISRESGAVALFGLLLLTVSLLQMLALPAVLTPLLAGMLVKSTDRRPHLWPQHFGTAGSVLVVMLFVLTGVTLTPSALWAGGLAALALIVVRIACKLSGVALFGTASGLGTRQTLALGIGLLPLSGLAFLLAEDIRLLYPEFGARIGAVVWSMVAILELLSPIGVQWALRFSQETREGSRPWP